MSKIKIRPLAEKFRVGEYSYIMKKRTGQAALYTKYARGSTTLVGFEVFELKTCDLGKTLEFGEIYLMEVLPKPENIISFNSGQEVEAWTAFQNLIDKQARMR